MSCRTCHVSVRWTRSKIKFTLPAPKRAHVHGARCREPAWPQVLLRLSRSAFSVAFLVAQWQRFDERSERLCVYRTAAVKS